MTNLFKNKKTIISVIVLFVLVCFLSSSFILVHAGHQCNDDHCVICMQIQSASSLLKLMSLYVLAFILMLSTQIQIALIYINKIKFFLGINLISLKVRMNN